MSGDQVAPVVAGLAVSIALINLSASFTKPAFTMSDEEILRKIRSLPEVQALYSRYPPFEQLGREGTMTYLHYQIGIA